MKHVIQGAVLKALILVLTLSAYVPGAFAQKTNFDIVSFITPKSWKKEIKPSAVIYTFIDKKDKSWCQVGIYKSIESTADIDADFETGWNDLVKNHYKIDGDPQTSEVSEAEGWKIKAGSGKFTFNNKPAIALLTTFSGYGRCVRIIATTGSQRYLKDFENFIGTIELNKPTINAGSENSSSPDVKTVITDARKDGYSFNTTNFDDGWTSKAQEDWVEVTKGDSKVLLHYPSEKVKPANTDVNVMCEAAWNALVASRYSNIENYQITPSVIGYPRPYYAQASLTDNATGKKVFVALFKNANTGWIEIITPDKNSFIQNFGLDVNTVTYYSDNDIWDKIVKMNGYNKFAIASTDFAGNWSDHFASNTYYANVYTGASAGMSTYSSSQSFEFGSNQTYKWHLIAANSYGGNTNFAQAKGTGIFKVLNNWQILFSEMEGKPKTFDAYFSCVKGGRILWMNDAQYPGSGIFTGYSKK